MSINPPDAPGFTQMYSFGVKMRDCMRVEYFVITVRAPTEAAAQVHIRALLNGRYKNVPLQFYTDLDKWKEEAKQHEQH